MFCKMLAGSVLVRTQFQGPQHLIDLYFPARSLYFMIGRLGGVQNKIYLKAWVGSEWYTLH